MKITFVNVVVYGKCRPYPVSIDRCKCCYRWKNDESQYFERILNAFEYEIIIERRFWYIQTECCDP